MREPNDRTTAGPPAPEGERSGSAPGLPGRPGPSRRVVLTGALGVGALAVAGAVAAPHLPFAVRRRLGLAPDPVIPDVPAGQVTLESVTSLERGIDVDLFTAVPAGYGDGAGLPVVVVLHGATGRPDQYGDLGLPQFLTAAVRQGTPPFVLAGADGGTLFWSAQPDGDDPAAMVLRELPRWLGQRGFDARRRALWGWSMGGYGVLHLAEVQPGWARATAAFSPAVAPGDAVSTAADRLRPDELGVWCGTDDPLWPAVQAFVADLPAPPAIASFSPGGHTRVYWNDQTLAAFDFLGRSLTA